MSNEALNWAWRQALKTGPKFVLVALADYADERHSCFPSFKKIEQRTGYDQRTIGRHVKALENAGLVKRQQRRYDDGRKAGFRFFLSVDADNPTECPVEDINPTKKTHQPDKNDIATVSKCRDNNPQVNHQLKPRDIDSARAPVLLDVLGASLRSVTGNAVDWQCPGIAVLTIPLGWVTGSSPFDLELDVLPTIRAICQARGDPEPIRSWAYFAKPIAKARDQRLTPNPEPKERRCDRPDNKYQKSNRLNAASLAALEDLELPDAGSLSSDEQGQPRGRQSRIASG
jgi:DNA-binding transcriptional ArsR family regulator